MPPVTTSAGVVLDPLSDNHGPVDMTDPVEVEKMQNAERPTQNNRDLTGSTLEFIAAIPRAGSTVDVIFYVNLQSPNWAWADGLQLTFPEGVAL